MHVEILTDSKSRCIPKPFVKSDEFHEFGKFTEALVLRFTDVAQSRPRGTWLPGITTTPSRCTVQILPACR